MSPTSSEVNFALTIPIILLIVVFFSVAIAVGLGVYVYRDAKKREMNAALWTLVVLLAPGLIGLIIYLIVRSDREIKTASCASCGNKIDESFRVCPYCSHVLKPHCPHCSQPLGPGWFSCAACGEPIPDELRVPTTEREPHRDRGLTVILSAVIIIPIVLIALAVAAFFMLTGRVDTGGDVHYDESVSLEPDGMTIGVNVSVHDDIENIYSSLITYYSNGAVVETCGTSNADGSHLRGEIMLDSNGFPYSERIDEIEIEFFDEHGNVVATSGKIKITEDSTFIEGALDLSHGKVEFSY